MANPGPNVQVTEHPLYGGGGPDYLGSVGGTIGFFADPYGASFLGYTSGTTLTVTQLLSGTIQVGQPLVQVSGVLANSSITALGTGAGGSNPITALGTYTITPSQTVGTSSVPVGLQTLGTAVAQPGYALTGSQNLGAFNTASTGAICKYQLNVNVTGPLATTTTEVTSTVSSGVMAGLATSSVVFVNKLTAQAGYGIGGYRVSAANTLAITYVNVSTGPITTATEINDVIEIKAGPLVTTAVLSPANVAVNTTAEQIFTITGNACLPGTVAIVNKPTAQAGLFYNPFARVVAPNQVGITFGVVTTGAVTTGVTPTASETYQFAFIPQLNAFNPTYIYTISGTQNATTASTTTEATTTVVGTLLTDMVSGFSKPTVNASTAITTGRVTAAGVIGITYVTQSAASTPSSSEILTVAINRQVPLNPALIYNAALATSAVAGTTSTEVTTTVTGLLVSTSVAVTKPSNTPGLVVVGARVSAANTLAVTYMNLTTTSINVPSETYTIANIQLQGPSSAASVSSAQSVTQTYYPAVQQTLQVAAATRTALVALGLMTGV